MVFTTVVNLIRSKGPDKMWRKRKILNMTGHFWGRNRNCIGFARKILHRALVYATKARALKKDDMAELHNIRIAGACTQFGISLRAFRTGLSRSRIALNCKSLADLAIYEPKSFESLAMIARERCVQDGIYGVDEKEFDNRVYFYNDEQALEKKKDEGKIAANYSAKFKNKIQY